MGIPLTLISGYLGTGKTTLINNLLRTTKKKIALLVNDFGDVNIDESLIEARTETVMSIAGGCVCCSYGNELIETLESMSSSKFLPDHIVLEASGIALPSKIIQTISLMDFLSFHGTVLLTDASRLTSQLNDVYISDTISLQIEQHDLLVLNKTDLLEEDELLNCIDTLSKRFEIRKFLKTVNAYIEEEDILIKHIPLSRTAGIIFFTCNCLNITVDKQLITNICNISEVTINKCYKKLESNPHIREVVKKV